MAGKLTNMGVIIYDIPDTLKTFGNYLRRKLRAGRALPVNKSVYLINWSDKPHIDRLVEKTKERFAEKLAEFGLRLDARILKYDDASAEEAYRMAADGLNFLIAGISTSLKSRLDKMAVRGEAELPNAVQVRFIKKLQEAECLAVAFCLMDDVEIALEGARKAVSAQIAADVAAKYLKPSEKSVLAAV